MEANAEIKLIDFAVDSNLINPQFDGYKLNLDKLPIKELPLPIGVPDFEPSGSQFSFEQAKIFSHAGQLYFDSWNSTESWSVFMFPQKDGNFYRIDYNTETRQWGDLKLVAEECISGGSSLPPSVVFPSKELAVLSNGSNNVAIYKTTEGRILWEQLFIFSPFETNGIYIQDARLIGENLEVLVESVVDHEKTSPDDHKVFDLIVAWVTLATNTWHVVRKQDISLPGNVNFITLDEKAVNLIVNSSSPPKILADTDGLLPVQRKEIETNENELKESAPFDSSAPRLDTFTSDKPALGGLGTIESFNSAQNEDCDMTEDEMSTIYWYSRQKQAVVQQCDITGHQYLFEKKLPGQSSKICIRYDVDGMLFSLSNDQLENISCFAAFGYIQASKTSKRWCASAPDNSYIVLAEFSNHAFVYYQSTDVNSELLNRKTKEKIATVAKQQVVSLKSRENAMEMDDTKNFSILAAHAENKAFFLLTEDMLYAINLE